MAPYLPLRKGDDIINHCARGCVSLIVKQSRVDTFCYNDKCHSVWFVSIDLCKLCLQTYHSPSSTILGTFFMSYIKCSVRAKKNCKILNTHTKTLHQHNKVQTSVAQQSDFQDSSVSC